MQGCTHQKCWGEREQLRGHYSRLNLTKSYYFYNFLSYILFTYTYVATAFLLPPKQNNIVFLSVTFPPHAMYI